MCDLQRENTRLHRTARHYVFADLLGSVFVHVSGAFFPCESADFVLSAVGHCRVSLFAVVLVAKQDMHNIENIFVPNARFLVNV